MRPIQARFHYGTGTYYLNLASDGNSYVHYAKGTPSQDKLAPTACRRMVSGSISLPLSGFFSPFPHGTGTLSVSWEYLALPDGPGRFAQNSTCSALLRILLCQSPLRLRGCHPLWPFFPKRSARINCTISQSYYPSGALLRRWFGLFPGRSPLLGESLLFSLPGGTKMFQFPPLAL